MKNYRLAILVVGLVLTLGTAPSWGQDPSSNDTSDDKANTGGGMGALLSITTGTYNTGYGHNALFNNTYGILNTGIGQGALTTNYDGSENTATGAGALASNIHGNNNTAVGFQALLNSTNSSYNTALGFNALVNNTGEQNTAVGEETLANNLTGGANTAIGFQALLNKTKGGSANIAVGYQAGYNLTNGAFNIYLGHPGVTTESYTMRLGFGAGTVRTFISGVYGASITGRQVFINSNGRLGTLASSARFKRDIQTMGDRSRRLLQLRPVTFRYKHDPQGERQYGLIAEEVAKIYPDLVTKGADGKVDSVQYHELIPMLLNEVQHQQQALDAQAQQLAQLKAQNERLQAGLAEQNVALAARLDKLESGGACTAMLATQLRKASAFVAIAGR